jgi:hypothetical protein
MKPAYSETRLKHSVAIYLRQIFIGHRLNVLTIRAVQVSTKTLNANILMFYQCKLLLQGDVP